MRGIDILLDVLADSGVRTIFGNPGTTELPLTDALVTDKRIEYILGLQEIPVMGMADGYAMASRRLGVVNLHISCGVGNAMGMLYNAYREGTPLLVTAGQTDRRLRFEEPILWGDMVAVVRPWTKWAIEVDRVEDIAAAARRAIQIALTPPTGPVFLSLPLDVQMESVARESIDLTPPRLPDRNVRPPLAALHRAAQLLLSARNPAILAGSRVTEADATGELVAVAERLGVPVISEPGTTHGRLAFPCNHPLYDQGLPLWSPEIIERLKDFDGLLVVGMDLLRQYVYHEPACAIPRHIRLVHLDEDPYQIGKNYPTEVGLIGDTKAGLAELDSALAAQMTSDQSARAKQRSEQIAARHHEQRAALVRQIASESAVRPMTPLVAMDSIGRALLPRTAVIEEAVTTTNTTLERLGLLPTTDGYFGHRGWALGWGLGVSLGVKLAWPDRPVLAILGEGAAMYGIQGLWSAARYRIPVTFVICNNAQYQILKIGARGLALPNAAAGKFLGMDLIGPEIDFVALAGSLGIAARRITEPEELTSAVSQSLGSDCPQLFDVAIRREAPTRLEYG